MGGERKSLWTGLVVDPQREVDRAMRLLTEHSDVWGVAVKERSRWNGTDNVRADVVISCKRCRASTRESALARGYPARRKREESGLALFKVRDRL